MIGQHQQLRSQEHPDPGVRLQPVPDGRPPPAQGPRSLPGGGLLRLRRQTSDADAVQVDANYGFFQSILLFLRNLVQDTPLLNEKIETRRLLPVCKAFP